jgi:hypothetical protein
MECSEARAFARRSSDEFMALFPVSMRLSSGYNSLMQLLQRGLTLSVYPTSMFSVTCTGEKVTTGFSIMNKVHEHFRGVDAAMRVERYPDVNVLRCHTNDLAIDVVRKIVTLASYPQAYCPWSSEGQIASFEDVGGKQLVVSLPMMNGSFMYTTDSDGHDGVFVHQGSEQFHSLTFEDAPNRVVTDISDGGVVSILFVSQRLEEVARVRAQMHQGSSVRNFWMYLTPDMGVGIRATLTCVSERGEAAVRKESKMVPLASYLDSLLWHHAGDERSRRRVTVRDVDAFFVNLEHIACDTSPASLRDETECARFRMLVANAHEMSLGHLPSGSSAPPPDVLCGEPLWMELFPHIADRGLGCPSDEDGTSRLGMMRRMLAIGFASLYGVVRHGHMDPRGMRVRTAEMEAFVAARGAILSNAQPKHDLRAVTRDVARSNITFAKPSVTVSVARTNESDLRRSFPNLVQHLHMIKYQHDNVDNDVNPSKRRYHPASIGTVCQADTPSTVRVGKDMNLNYNTLMSPDVDPILVCELLKSCMSPPGAHPVPVFINGVHVGSARDAAAMRESARTLRRRVITRRCNAEASKSYKYRPFMGIGVDVREELFCRGGRFRMVRSVHIRCDSGRLIKPVYILGHSLLPGASVGGGAPGGAPSGPPGCFWGLVDAGAVEFIDVDEECSDDVHMVAELWKAAARHTHADIHPALLQGTLAGLVPHSKNNHGVKVTNMCNHFKAVMHKFSLQHARRFDTQSSGHVPKSCVTYMGYHNQQPLVRPPGYDWHEMGHRPHGYNIVIAVCTAGGANQEDAVVIKRSLRDRGFGFGMCERTFFTECHQSDTVMIHKGVGSTFGPNDLLMETSSSQRPAPRRAGGAAARGAPAMDSARSTHVRAGLQESGVVTEVRRVDYDSQTAANKKVKYLISTHEACIPQLGDKFASPHAQKGVIGKIVDDMDMPFTRDGMRADVLLNPQSIPSRMTVAQLIEIIHGSHAAATGEHRREFTYDETPVEQVMQELAAASGIDGMREAGLQAMYDPYTGEEYPAKVFTGVCYYSRLKHLVSEKVRANDIVGGEINPITRQGGSGRKHNGGIKAAEMERWSIVGNGAVHTVNEMYRKLSDGAELHVERDMSTSDESKVYGGLRGDPFNVSPNSDRIESNYSTAACIHRLNAAMIDLDITTQTRSFEMELPEM